MKRYDLIIVGAGPAGLSAAIEAAGAGLNVIVFDENAMPGGQLFKQIHKFFGSKEHQAKIRGFKIGDQLLKEASELGVEVSLSTIVTGIYPNREVVVMKDERVFHYKADAIIVATGASENMINFKGWTLPGVIGAGAAQTMMNLHGVKPGEKVLMLGSGNVGLVVSFQLLQAGCEVVGIVDAAPRVGGYGVHAAKVARTGVPFYLSHTIIEAEGAESLEKVTIGQVDENWQIISGSEKTFDVDTICLAVGLSPMSQLLRMAGCEMVEDPKKGGTVPVCSERGETSIRGIFVAGDVSGIEEASSAMIEGRIAGLSVAEYLGYIDKEKLESSVKLQEKSLEKLRQGMFAPENRGKVLTKTDEGYEVSQSLLEKGYIADHEIEGYPGVKKCISIHPVIECTQNIPCNPCQDSCPKGCIKIGENITALPEFDTETECVGCGMCVAACSGQSIFLINEEAEATHTHITIPYEFLPLPQAGVNGFALGRGGTVLCESQVVDVKSVKAFDKTNLLTIRVPREMGMKARFFKQEVNPVG
ncbi:FAD-dependent oxidoreductase [Eubacteriaceae bacterium ES3]|nr:FAD-dependent oxidoreductase [Eubacteriaceae bacterium ES3]